MMLSFRQVSDYKRDGFVILENVFSQEEVTKMIAAIESGGRVSQTSRENTDVSGKKSKLAIWYDLGDDIWSAASICPRLVNPARILLGEDAAFFHGKVMLKEAHTGGAWEWHQDYGYWYNEGFVYPNMISAFVALDPNTIENGCLQVLKGTHRLGRLEHGRTGGQTGANPTRIEMLEGMFEKVHCELRPGSVLFFHSNLLHSSAANTSDKHRRSFIVCYTAVSNPQVQRKGTTFRPSCPVGDDRALSAF